MTMEKQPIGSTSKPYRPGETAAERTERGTRVYVLLLAAAFIALGIAVFVYATRDTAHVQEADARNDGALAEYGESTELAENPAPVQGVPEVGTKDR